MAPGSGPTSNNEYQGTCLHLDLNHCLLLSSSALNLPIVKEVGGPLFFLSSAWLDPPQQQLQPHIQLLLNAMCAIIN
jgi:hypothetical protein